jgi:hypothetical protein
MHLHEPRNDGFDDAIFRTPNIKRDQSFDVLNAPFRIRHHSTRSETDGISDSATIITTEEETQGTRLKGTIWPGMDLFDSATPEQKRKRNQRKDNSVLEQMKLTSQAVTATECIWTQDGDFQRERDIYASPSIDGSPLPLAAPSTPSRKRKYRSRHRSPIKSEEERDTKVVSADKGKRQIKKRRGRTVLADVTNVRQTRASARNAASKAVAAPNSSGISTKSSEQGFLKLPSLGRDHKGSFDVFKDPPTSPGTHSLALLLDFV